MYQGLMLRNIAIVALSISITLLVVEIGLRFFFVSTPAKAYPCPDGGHPAYLYNQCPTSQDRMGTAQFSGDLLYTPIPESKGLGWSTDEHGFRRNQPVVKVTLPVLVPFESHLSSVATSDNFQEHIVGRSSVDGNILISFDAKIKQGTYNWAWRITVNGLIRDSGNYMDNIQSSPSPHEYRTIVTNGIEVKQGDTIALEMAHANNDGQPVLKGNQEFDVENFSINLQFDNPEADKHKNIANRPNDGPASSIPIQISVTGGSTAWGVGVRNEQTFPAQLQALLIHECPGMDVVVLNAAFPAQTSGQERRRFETDVLPLRPQIHMAFSGFNDIYNSYTGILPHQNRDYFDIGKRFGVKGVDDFIPVTPKQGDSALRIVYLGKLAYFNVTHDAKKISQAIKRRPVSVDETVLSSLRTTKIFADWSKEYGYEFYYALQPSIYSTKKILTSDEIKIRKSSADFGNFHNQGYGKLKAALAKAAKKYGFSYIDMDNALRDESQDVFIDNVHFGDRGYMMLASLMVTHLLQVSPTIQHHCKEMK
ncbi:GDSL-type esterase/lipase family protein [Candidatus Njordibacter sp. Uisw_039]|uniref:SGNH/GDSL hydrolase family protein n=1 Tax=Candidatus Njordibacter sp. Uisw_039 TaxID=3230972 RepID=UPI003D4500A2